jgi:integral membrane protein
MSTPAGGTPLAGAPDQPAAPPAPAPAPQPVRQVPRAALVRYRVIAWVVGTGLIVLVCIGVPLKYLADQKAVVAAVGPLHGALYVVYLLITLDLAMRCRWHPVRTVLVMLAGTVPFLSFVAERMVTTQVEGRAR